MSNVYVHFSQTSLPARYSVVNFQLGSHSLRFREVIPTAVKISRLVKTYLLTAAAGSRIREGSPSGTGQTLHAEPGFSDRFENDLTHSPILGKMNNDGRRSVGKRIRCGFLCLERNEVFSWKIRLKTVKKIRIKGLPERAASA